MVIILIFILIILMDQNFHLQMEEKNMKKYLLKVQFLMIKKFLGPGKYFLPKLLVMMVLNLVIKEEMKKLKIIKKLKKLIFLVLVNIQ